MLATEINVVLGDNKAYRADVLAVDKCFQGVGQYRLVSKRKILFPQAVFHSQPAAACYNDCP